LLSVKGCHSKAGDPHKKALHHPDISLYAKHYFQLIRTASTNRCNLSSMIVLCCPANNQTTQGKPDGRRNNIFPCSKLFPDYLITVKEPVVGFSPFPGSTI
jgi:hypothetical protein